MSRNNSSALEAELLSVPVPQDTETYTAIPHGVIIKELKDAIRSNGLSIVDSRYYSNSFGRKVSGDFIIHNPDSAEFRYQVGWKNSYDKSMSFGLALGLNVFVCSNGVVSGEYTVARKHTGNALEVVREFIYDVVPQVKSIADEAIAFMEHLKKVPTTLHDAAAIAGQLLIEEEIINATQMSILNRELKKSDNFAFSDNGEGNMYKLYNNVTEALKTSNASNRIAVHSELDAYFRKTSGWNAMDVIEDKREEGLVPSTVLVEEEVESDNTLVLPYN